MRFITDNTVGSLRRWMSLMGYDVVYGGCSARELVRDARVVAEGGLVIGRCPGLVARAKMAEKANHSTEQRSAIGKEAQAPFFHIASPVLTEQIAEVARLFPLDFRKTLFTRCTHCNLPLAGPMRLEGLAGDGPDQVPERVREWRETFFQCGGCGRVYWEGTHTERVRKVLREDVGLDV